METLSGPELLVAQLIGSIAVLFGWAMTQILLFMTEMLVAVAGYNEFATADAVNRGWVIVRDLTNMFFILVMLIIAFGTILGVEEYSYKRMLPRLLIMAVVINFSKVVCGLLIDFSQVVMLTFVNGFSAIAGGNFVRMFQVSGAWNVVAANAGQAAEANFTWSTVGALVLGGVLMMTAAVAVFIMTLMLVGRIVMLWLLIVMSPLAFFLSAFPKGKAAEMYGKWWGMFGNYVVIGPFIAFFLWLSLAVAGSGDIANTMQIVNEGSTAGTSLFVSELGGRQQFYSFVIAIALLMGGMSMSAQFGVMGGSMMSGAASYIQNKGIGAVKGTGRLIGRGARLTDSWVAKQTGGVSVGNVLAIPRRLGEGTEARIKGNYEAARKDALAGLREGGVKGRLQGFIGASDEVARKTGIIQFAAGAAAAPIRALPQWIRGQGSDRSTYLDKAAAAQKDLDAAKKQRETADARVKEAEADQAAKKAALDNFNNVAFSDEDFQQLGQSWNRMKDSGLDNPQLDQVMTRVLQKANSGENVTIDDMEALQQAGLSSPKTREALREHENTLRSEEYRKAVADEAIASQRLGNLNAAAVKAAGAEALAAGNVQKWLKGAERAGVSGFGPEVPKHAMDATVTSSMLSEALNAKDYTLAQQLVVKLGEDGELADALKLRGHGEGLSGVKAFAQELTKKHGMPAGTVMAALSEVDAKYKAKGNTEYSGMIKGGPGGKLRFVEHSGDNREYEAGRLKAGQKGSMESKLREAGKTSLFQVTDASGKKVIDAAGAALIAQSIGSIVKTVENGRMSADMMRMFVDKQAEVMQAVKDSGVSDSDARFGELKSAIEKMTEQLKDVPPDVGDAISKVYASRRARGA